MIQQANGMISLPDLARETYSSPRELRRWMSLGLVRGVRIDHSAGRHYWYVRLEDKQWVLTLAELVRRGFSVELLAAAAKGGQLEQCITDMAKAADLASHRVPQWLRRETA